MNKRAVVLFISPYESPSRLVLLVGFVLHDKTIYHEHNDFNLYEN